MLSLFCRGLLSLTLVLLSSVALAKDALLAGERLNANESLISLNGSYRFILQGDGNLVLRNASGSALWASATNGKGGVRLNMQGDGNLVLYTASGSAVWSSKTNGKSAIKAVMQDDGNFVLYTAANAAVWSTNTAKAGGGGGGTPGTGEAVKVAFIGDTGAGTNFQSVLNLIKAEKAQLTVVAGDTSYNRSQDDDWDARVRNTLGASDPAIVVAGNHDYGDSNFGDICSFGQARLSRQSAVQCSGAYAEKMTCRFKHLYFVMSAIGSSGSRSDHETYIANSLNNSPAGAWRICAWHKNQRDMQVGGKTDEVGWTAYETCRQKGAIISTGHEHSYSRTHLLSNMTNKTVASTASSFSVSPGKTFAFVSGLGGIEARDQERSGSWWAKIYTSTQGATYGALFGTFYTDRADFYFKNIKGQVIDQYTVTKGY